MRKVVVSQFVTLDGVMEAPHEWSFPYWSDEIAKFKLEELMGSDALLLGRITYQGFADAWPSRTDEEGFADRINSFPKYVVSTTLREASWNNSSVIRRNVTGEIALLKQQDGQDILINGSCQLVNSLVNDNLIDEYRLLVYPIVLGKGLKLFKDGVKTNLKLVESTPYLSGVVRLIYQPA
jgi:dihydrofolate reductase